LKRGYDLPQQRRKPGVVPIVSSSGISGFHSQTMVKAPGVVTGRYGTIGEVFYVTSDFWPLNTTLYVRDFKCNDPRFISYFLKTINFQSCSDKAAVPGVNRNHLHELSVRVPPLTEQRAIAHILGTLDDKIELNRRTNETLEAMARALFKSWFVDFDPVRAKAAGRKPAGMDEATAALFPDGFEQSELGEIPRGWRVVNFANFASLNPEIWSKKDYPDRIEYVDFSNTKWGRIESTATYSKKDAPSRAQRILRSRDTIVGTVRPGNGSYALIDHEGLTGSTGFAVLRPKHETFAEFIYLAATSAQNLDMLAQLADGGAYPAVRAEVIIEQPVVCPPNNTIARFSATTASLLSRFAQSERESRSLAKLRDTLLPRLLSGEVSVAHLVERVEAAL
jgi:type I restriction enzyme S subunit